MIFGVDGLKCVRICNDGADAHHLVCPVGFGVDNSEFAHAASSLLFLWILYRKQERKARGMKLSALEPEIAYQQHKDRIMGSCRNVDNMIYYQQLKRDCKG